MGFLFLFLFMCIIRQAGIIIVITANYSLSSGGIKDLAAHNYPSTFAVVVQLPSTVGTVPGIFLFVTFVVSLHLYFLFLTGYSRKNSKEYKNCDDWIFNFLV